MNEQEIDIRELINILWSRMWVILLVVILAAGLGAVYTFYMVTPMYQAATTVYVGRTITDNADPDSALYQELLIGEKLVNDYRELVKSRQVAGLVLERMKTETMDAGEIREIVNVEAKANTRFIEISAKHEDPVKAALIANLTAEVFKEKAVEIMDIENVQIIDEAILPKNPSSPNKAMNMAISAVIGLMLGVMTVFLIEYLDNKIRTKEDVENELGLPVIGVVMVIDEKVKKKSIKEEQYGIGGMS